VTSRISLSVPYAPLIPDLPPQLQCVVYWECILSHSISSNHKDSCLLLSHAAKQLSNTTSKTIITASNNERLHYIQATLMLI